MAFSMACFTLSALEVRRIGVSPIILHGHKGSYRRLQFYSPVPSYGLEDRRSFPVIYGEGENIYMDLEKIAEVFAMTVKD